MTSRTAVLQEVMSELSSGLRRSLRTSSLLQHSLTTGEFRESLVRNALIEHLPGRYDVSSGIVVNSSGDVSKQQDIVITDSFIAPPFLSDGVIGLHPAETVVGVIEVKSAGTADNIADGIAKCASFKELYPDTPRPFTSVGSGRLGFGETSEKPFAGILALSRGATAETLLERFVDEVRGISELDRPNAVIIIDDGVITWAQGDSPDQLTIFPSSTGATHVTHRDLGEHALLLFYLLLIESLKRYHPPPLDLFAYVTNAGGLGSHNLRFHRLGDERVEAEPDAHEPEETP